MKKFFVILACKMIRLIGRLTGRGSSLPGQIALKLDPDILSKIKMPPYIVAVTGSNGKTSTVELIARILKRCREKLRLQQGRLESDRGCYHPDSGALHFFRQGQARDHFN